MCSRRGDANDAIGLLVRAVGMVGDAHPLSPGRSLRYRAQTAPMEPVVHLRSAVALLGRFPALSGVDLDVARHEVVLLRGANGAGKTTLLRMCAGLVALASGTGSVLGVDLAGDRRALRRRVGMLGHANGLYLELTVAENVRFWGKAAGASDAEVEAALTQLGLTGRLATTTIDRCSAGQRRRAALAALVVRRPELWLLDEPHAGLDADGRDLVDALVRRAAAAGATVIVASHELERTTAIADREVHLAGGRHVIAPATTPAEERT